MHAICMLCIYQINSCNLLGVCLCAYLKMFTGQHGSSNKWVNENILLVSLCHGMILMVRLLLLKIKIKIWI